MAHMINDAAPRALEVELDSGELRGLQAVAAVAAAASGEPADPGGTAQSLLHAALETRLEELGLAWAPSADAVADRVAEARKPDARLVAFAKRDGVRQSAASALAALVVVLLWGGYIRNWQWTGFSGNEQLWDWLRLLLLPMVVATIPLWLRHREYVSRRRRRIYLACTAAFLVFVPVGYLVPLNWTGFPGNTLWNWLGLILLPVALASVRFMPSAVRWLRHSRAATAGAVATALLWVLTIVGGYEWHWTWTGYQGNTLWDWLQLLLLPLLVPTLLMPAVVRWVSDNAEPGQVGNQRYVPKRAVISGRRSAAIR
jgi:hypothetical protein